MLHRDLFYKKLGLISEQFAGVESLTFFLIASLLLCLDNSCGRRNSGIESILKKDRTQAIPTDLQSSSGDRSRQRRNDTNVSVCGDGPRKSNGCGNPRRVLFKNNVSVYRFDSETPQTQNAFQTRNGSVSGYSWRPTRENGFRSNGYSQEPIIRPPTSSCSSDIFRNKWGRRTAATEPDDRHVDRQLNSSHRRTNKYTADNNTASSPSSTAVVGNFEVIIIIIIIIK